MVLVGRSHVRRTSSLETGIISSNSRGCTWGVSGIAYDLPTVAEATVSVEDKLSSIAMSSTAVFGDVIPVKKAAAPVGAFTVRQTLDLRPLLWICRC